MKKIKELLKKDIVKKIIGYGQLVFNILLIAFVLELVMGESSFGRFTGWGLLTLLIIINLWGLWASRKMLKNIKQYIFYTAEEKAKQYKEERDIKE